MQSIFSIVWILCGEGIGIEYNEGNERRRTKKVAWYIRKKHAHDRTPLSMASDIDSRKCPSQNQRGAQYILQPAACHECIPMFLVDGEKPDQACNAGEATDCGPRKTILSVH